jgi:large subunit ribosomal protein L30
MLRIELVRSLIGNTARNRATVQALGLRKMRQVVLHQDCPSIRGMIHKVQHMVKVVEVPDEPVQPAKKATAAPEAPAKAVKKTAAATEPVTPEKPVKKAKKKSEESSSEPE